MKIWAFGHFLKIRAEVLWNFIVVAGGGGVVAVHVCACVKTRRRFQVSSVTLCLHCSRLAGLSVAPPPLPPFPVLRSQACMTTPGFDLGARDLSSGSHASITRTPTPMDHLPNCSRILLALKMDE